MRLVSFGPEGREQAGVLIGERVVPVAEFAPELGDHGVRQLLTRAALTELAGRLALVAPGSGLPLAEVRLGPPITDPGKIICVGLNYRGHAEEQQKPWPEAPLLFAKAPTALCGPRDTIRLPTENCRPDYEVELAIVIGRRGRSIAVDQADQYIAGYMVANDVSARRWQHSDGQWYRAKSCDTFFPCGPALVTRDEIRDYRQLLLTTTIGNDCLQRAMASDLIHDIPQLIAYISRYQTLVPGDIISTGTPAGVGCYRNPPRFLQPGDRVVCAIDGLGELVNPVALES